MTVSCDSNVLIYAMDGGSDVHSQAAEIMKGLARCGAVLPDQCLREFLAVAHRRQIISPVQARGVVALLMEQFTVVRSELEDLRAGSELAERHRLQYYDALLCCTVRRAGCSVLLSRDMQDGFNFGPLRIVNPFAPANAELVADLLA